MEVSKVRHSDIVKWVAGLSAGDGADDRPLSASTVRQVYKLFSQILELAVRNQNLAANPAKNVPLPRILHTEPRFLTEADVERLAAAVDYLATLRDQRQRAGRAAAPIALEVDAAGVPIIPAAPISQDGLAVRLLAYTGMRFGELAGLRAHRVDLATRRITIAEAVTEVDGKLVTGPPKNHQTRTVPFRSSFDAALGACVAGKSRDAYVFDTDAGTALRLRNWSKRTFAPAVELSGLAPLTPHDLRHTAASLAISQGMNVKAVQRLLGHASASMTLDVYAGLFPDDLTAIGEGRETGSPVPVAD
jgi:integrase